MVVFLLQALLAALAGRLWVCIPPANLGAGIAGHSGKLMKQLAQIWASCFMTYGDRYATPVLDIFRLLFSPFYIQIQDSAHLAFTGRLRYLYSSCHGYRCCHRSWVPVRQQDCVFSGLHNFRIPGTPPEKIAAFGASFIRGERTSLFNLLVAAQLVQDARCPLPTLARPAS